MVKARASNYPRGLGVWRRAHRTPPGREGRRGTRVRCCSRRVPFEQRGRHTATTGQSRTWRARTGSGPWGNHNSRHGRASLRDYNSTAKLRATQTHETNKRSSRALLHSRSGFRIPSGRPNADTSRRPAAATRVSPRRESGNGRTYRVAAGAGSACRPRVVLEARSAGSR
jgi:hypothetical protein